MATDRGLYTSVLSGRYPSLPMRQLFSDDNKFGGWRRMWHAIAEGQHQFGVEQITAKALEAMANHLDDIDYEFAARLERELKHDVVAHVHTFGAVCPEAAGFIHLGCTSCDVTDNAELVQMRDGLCLLQTALARLVNRMAHVALLYRSLPVVGFTHWQSAQPVTFGHRVAMWLQDLFHHLKVLERLEHELMFRGIKGATGTQDAMLKVLGGDRKKLRGLERQVAQTFGFRATKVWPITGQTYSRMADSEILQAFALLAASIHKMCLDLRFLQHLKEVDEPFDPLQTGSSAMAFKRNPMRSERVCSLARHVLALATEALMTQMNQGLERTLDDSAGRRIYIPEAFLATDAILIICQNIFEGLVVYPKMMERHLDEELPFLITEEIIVAMVEADANRQEVHEKMRVLAQEAGRLVKKEGRDNELLSMLKADPYFALVHRSLDSLMDPTRFLGTAVEQVEEFVGEEVLSHLAANYPGVEEGKSDLTV